MIVVVMGVAGSGKSTIGAQLAAVLHCSFLEGDSLHPPVNVGKMQRNIPLEDQDRFPWLAAIHAEMQEASARGRDLVVACSALKQSYRQILAKDVPVVWVYLKGDFPLFERRLHDRTSHFMKADLLASQFDALEAPLDAIVVDASSPPGELVAQIVARLPARVPPSSAAAPQSDPSR